jgi:hypothetical protein
LLKFRFSEQQAMKKLTSSRLVRVFRLLVNYASQQRLYYPLQQPFHPNFIIGQVLLQMVGNGSFLPCFRLIATPVS